MIGSIGNNSTISTNSTTSASQPASSTAGARVQDKDSAGFASVLEGMRAPDAAPSRPDSPKGASNSKPVQPPKAGAAQAKPAAEGAGSREPAAKDNAADTSGTQVAKAKGADSDQASTSSKAASDKDEAHDKDVQPGTDPSVNAALTSPLPQTAAGMLTGGTAAQAQAGNAQTATTEDELSGTGLAEGPARRNARAIELRTNAGRQSGMGGTQAGAEAGQDPAAEGAGQAESSTGRGFIDFIAGAKALAQGEAAQERQPAGGTFDALQSLADARQVADLSSTLATSQPALAQQASVQQAAAADSRIAARLGSPDWNDAFGQKIVWMAKDGEQSAQLSMNPPDLGPVQVVLSISQSQASADFSAAQPETRQALQDALPRLKEMLSDAGISLTQANVHAGLPQQQRDSARGWGDQAGGTGQGGRMAGTAGGNAHGQDDAAGVTTVRTRAGVGLVNTFA